MEDRQDQEQSRWSRRRENECREGRTAEMGPVCLAVDAGMRRMKDFKTALAAGKPGGEERRHEQRQ